jgi:hypothetical protein
MVALVFVFLPASEGLAKKRARAGKKASVGKKVGAGKKVGSGRSAAADDFEEYTPPSPEEALRLGEDWSATLKRLESKLQKGYLCVYSLEYKRAVHLLTEVLSDMKDLRPNPGTWQLFARAHVFLGMAYGELKEYKKFMDSFGLVLRLKPNMKLDPKWFSPKVIQRWEMVRKRQQKKKTGRLAISTQDSGALVYLDFAMVGKTPYIGDFAFGDYILSLARPGESAKKSFKVSISDKAVVKMGVHL